MAPWLKLVLLQVSFQSLFKTGRALDRSRSVGVVGGESVQVPQLTQATLDVRYVDLYVVLKTTGVHTKRGESRQIPSVWSWRLYQSADLQP